MYTCGIWGRYDGFQCFVGKIVMVPVLVRRQRRFGIIAKTSMCIEATKCMFMLLFFVRGVTSILSIPR